MIKIFIILIAKKKEKNYYKTILNYLFIQIPLLTLLTA